MRLVPMKTKIIFEKKFLNSTKKEYLNKLTGGIFSLAFREHAYKIRETQLLKKLHVAASK
jgi:hypothetical protein